MSESPGLLYVVATPIGNLGDISQRAQQILSEVDVIAAEDTRRTRTLLQHLGIEKSLISLHEHNERARVEKLLLRLQEGDSIALVSDAGTPLISDPGYHLVRQVRKAGLTVSPVPGPSALVAALSVSGLATDRFRFEGFLPAKRSARKRHLQALEAEACTLVFYESSHRITDAIEDLCEVLGGHREAMLARELTKVYETVLGQTLEQIQAQLDADPNQSRGEFVLVVSGAPKQTGDADVTAADALLKLLLAELPVKSASRLVATYLGLGKNTVYQRALQLQQDNDE